MRLGLTPTALVAAATLLAACGDESSSTPALDRAARADAPSVIQTSTPTSEPESAATPKAKQRPKRRVATNSAFVACDANITVRAATTTCQLAQSTFYEYWYSWNYLELSQFAAYSPAAEQWLEMTCRGERNIKCTADDGSEVRFPLAAVTAYTEDNARSYARSHTVSTDPGDLPASDSGEVDSDAEEGIDDSDNYDGEDYEQSVPYDRDCADFAETDFPTPPGDPDGLDADGDGIACES